MAGGLGLAEVARMSGRTRTRFRCYTEAGYANGARLKEGFYASKPRRRAGKANLPRELSLRQSSAAFDPARTSQVPTRPRPREDRLYHERSFPAPQRGRVAYAGSITAGKRPACSASCQVCRRYGAPAAQAKVSLAAFSPATRLVLVLIAKPAHGLARPAPP